MLRSITLAVLPALLLGLATQNNALARGFGGFHGGGSFGGGGGGFHAGGFSGGGFHAGGMEAGGYRGGGMEAGGYRGGGMEAGGYRGGGMEAGGYRGGGMEAGGFRANEFGGGASRGQLNSFLGLPTDGGMHAGGASAGRAAVAAAVRGGATGHVYEGPGGTTVYHGTAGAQGAAVGPRGAAAGGAFASGTAVKGPEGNVYTHDTTAARGVAAGPNGVEAGRSFSSDTALHGAGGTTVSRGTRYGTHAWSATAYHAQAIAGRDWFGVHPVFTRGWVGDHPWAWRPAAYTAATWANAAWRVATWDSVATWLAWDAMGPYSYNYGNSIVYQDGNVYYGTQPAGTASQYYQQAATLADTSADAPADNDSQWLPLGVFSLMAPDKKTPDVVLKLAINKQGMLRGNCYEAANQQTVAVQGRVDKKTQRVALRVGDRKDLVIETGLYSLTQDESTALVHSGPEQTTQYLMVRQKQAAQDQQQTASSGS